MTTKSLVISALALVLGATGYLSTSAYAAPQGPMAVGYDQDQGSWDAVPAEFREIQRKGFQDGIKNARKDFDQDHWPSVYNCGAYRHPHMSRSAWADYRDGFRRGYERAVQHLLNEQDHR